MSGGVDALEKREDQLALAAVVCGGTAALVGWRNLWAFVAGMALGLGGVALALRRRPPAGEAALPSRLPSWSSGVLALAVVALGCHVGVRILEGWSMGRLLADGAQIPWLTEEGRRWSIYGRLARDLGVVSSTAFLGLALLRHRRLAHPR